MKISIFGLGYVGTVSAACLAHQGHQVTGIDINPTKTEIINKGCSPIIEAEIEAMIAETVSAGRLRAITDATQGVNDSDVSLICVGTPSQHNGNLDLMFVKRVCEEIGQALRDKHDFHIVVLRSTVLPGTVETCVIPILEHASGKKVGKDFGFCFNPEFLREGTSVKDFYNPPYTVIGQLDPYSAQMISTLYQNLEAPLLVVPVRVAEMIKYVNNTFHALKVVFANEIGNICKQQGIDSHQVMDIFCMDSKLNLSPHYLKPGFAFGGSCLPKDLRALLHHSRSLDLRLPVLEAILPSNEHQVRLGFEIIQRTGKKKVGVLGFSFKAGTDDLRESPLVELIEMLIGKGYDVKLYDQNVSLARLYGANKAYIEHQIPHISQLMYDRAEDVLTDSDVLVIGNKSPEFVALLERVRPDQIVIDLVRIMKEVEPLKCQYQGIGW